MRGPDCSLGHIARGSAKTNAHSKRETAPAMTCSRQRGSLDDCGSRGGDGSECVDMGHNIVTSLLLLRRSDFKLLVIKVLFGNIMIRDFGDVEPDRRH